MHINFKYQMLGDKYISTFDLSQKAKKSVKPRKVDWLEMDCFHEIS